MWKSHQKLTKLNWSLFLTSITSLSIPEPAETARIWHLALRGGSSFPCECRVVPDCTKSSPGLQWEQHPQLLLALTVELCSQPQPGSGSWDGLSEWKLLCNSWAGHTNTTVSPAGKFSPLTETVHQEPAPKSHFSLHFWWWATLGIKSCILWHDHLTFGTKRQRKKIYNEVVSKLMTHLL